MSSRSSPRGNRPSSTTFITEMDSFNRMKSASRSNRRNYYANSINRKKSNLPRISGSQSMFSSNFGRADPTAPIAFDQGKLDHTYELLVKEIMDLKSDISPIRHTYLKLKDRLLFQRQCSVNSNENILLSEQFPDLSRAIGEGGTFSGLIEEFQIEIDDNTNMINELNNRFSAYWVVKLSCENDKERDELSMMKELLSKMKSQKKRLNSDLMRIKQSSNIQKIDNQRKQMHKLILDIGKAEQNNQKLLKSLNILEKEFDLEPTISELAPSSDDKPNDQSKTKVKFILGNENNEINYTNKNNTNKSNANTNNNNSKYNINFMSTPEAQAAFDEVEALEKELAQKRQIYLKKCDELIVIRNKQLKQLQELEKKQQKAKLKESETESTNSKVKKFHVSEPKKPPISSARGRKSATSLNLSKKCKRNDESNNSENNKNSENKSDKISNEELISHLLSHSEKSTINEELQEIPIEDESSNDDAGGIQIEDAP